MSPEMVSVPEVKPAIVTRQRALRIFLGRLAVDYVETFTGLAAAQLGLILVSPPLSADGWKLIAVQLAAPAFAAFVSSLRRAWPTIKDWLAPPEGAA